MIIDKKGCYLETKADNSLFCLYKLCQIRYNKTIYERRWDGMDVSEKMKYKMHQKNVIEKQNRKTKQKNTYRESKLQVIYHFIEL